MNRSFAITYGRQSFAGTVVPVCTRLMLFGVAALAVSVPRQGAKCASTREARSREAVHGGK